MDHLLKHNSHKASAASPRRTSCSSPPLMDPLLGAIPPHHRRPSLGASVRSVFRPGPGGIRTRRRLLILAFLISLVVLLYLNGVQVFSTSSSSSSPQDEEQARDSHLTAADYARAADGAQVVLPNAHSQQELDAIMQLASADPSALKSCLASWHNATSSSSATSPADPNTKPSDKSGTLGGQQPQPPSAEKPKNAASSSSGHDNAPSSAPPTASLSKSKQKSEPSSPPSAKYGTPLFSFLSRERASFERITDHVAPRSHPLKRRRGLLAVPVSGKSKAQIAPVLARFRQEHFDIMLFHYDAADWSDVPHYHEFTSIRVFGQTKFWFAKRFLVPELVENYDYIFLWDDDVGLDALWSPTQFVGILQQYGIHAAQPALNEGARPGYPQYETVRFHPETIWKKSVGRFADFVEVMFPVFSREAWQNCIWETIPYDGRSFWGVDNAWYPHCSSLGYCRFAIIDALPVAHLDQRSLYQPQQNNLREFGHYTNMYKRLCAHRPADLDPATTLRVIMICNFIRRRPLGWSFNSLATMDPVKDARDKQRCPEPSLWPGIENRPWFGEAVDEPVKYKQEWVDNVLQRAAQIHVGDHRDKGKPAVDAGGANKVEEKEDAVRKPAVEKTKNRKSSARRMSEGKARSRNTRKKTKPIIQQVVADATA